MSARPLSELMVRVLLAMRELEGNDRRYACTPNEIGSKADAARIAGGRGQGGRGRGYRVFGAAQQILPPLTALYRRGLIAQTSRDDGLSGVAYVLTEEGRAALTRQES